MTLRHFFASFLSISLIALPNWAVPASAQTFENLDSLDSLVAMTMGANIGQTGGAVTQIDRRLRLKPCPATPDVTGPVFGAAVVSCPAVGWRIRVPLVAGGNGSAQANGAMQAPVKAQIVIKRGDPVHLVAGGNGFSVSRNMVADEDGAIGALIRVRQDRRSPPVTARVTGPGEVTAEGI